MNLSSLPKSLGDAFRNPQQLIAVLVSLAALISTVILGTSSGTGDDEHTVPGSSDSYVDPGIADQVRLGQIEGELRHGLQELRADDAFEHLGGSGPLTQLPNLDEQALTTAKSNAVEGQEGTLDLNVTMLQAHLPVEEATAANLLGLWLHSEEHTELIVNSDYAFYGLGVAQGHGQVWVVLLLSAD